MKEKKRQKENFKENPASTKFRDWYQLPTKIIRMKYARIFCLGRNVIQRSVNILQENKDRNNSQTESCRRPLHAVKRKSNDEFNRDKKLRRKRETWIY